MDLEYNFYIRNLQEYYKLMDQLLFEKIEPLMVKIKINLLKGVTYLINDEEKLTVSLFGYYMVKINENILGIRDFTGTQLTDNEDEDLRDFCNWYDSIFPKVEKFDQVLRILDLQYKEELHKLEECEGSYHLFRGF